MTFSPSAKARGFKLIELNIDRAYVNSPVVYDILEAGGDIRAKPWGERARLPGMLTKRDFHIDARTQTITCPEGQVEPFEPGMTVEFDPEICGACPRRSQCTTSASGRGRTILIADDEGLQRTTRGRERVQVEHALAHVAARKGNTARYVGVRKNLFDLRRAAAIQNLEAVHRLSLAA